jgi:hypothetical protein
MPKPLAGHYICQTAMLGDIFTVPITRETDAELAFGQRPEMTTTTPGICVNSLIRAPIALIRRG